MKLEIKNGTFTYPAAGRTVLSNINILLADRDILAILGPNGAGKTTLLRCIMGLLRWQSGETLLNEKNLCEIPQRTLWQKISYVPQAKQEFVSYSVEEMILLGCASMVSPFSIPGKKEIEAVDRAIKMTRLEKLRHRSCAQLSGGELQMVLIARAIVSSPEVLILDEPESNLDFQNQLLVLNMISELSHEGMICIFNTHYPAHALRMANKVIMLSKDGNCCFGSAREVITEENIAKYFGVRSVIGNVETENAEYPDIIPLFIGNDTRTPPVAEEKVISCITVMLENAEGSEKLNGILHEYSDSIIGRMGLPCRKAGMHIITLMLDAPTVRVLSLSDKLRGLTNAHIKTSYMTAEDVHEK